MNIYYKIILIGILVYTFIVIKENYKEKFDQNFTLPSVKNQQVREEQQQNKADEFSIKKTIETGIGVHDRIRYDGEWE